MPLVERIRAWARTLKREIVAIHLALGDPRTPWYARACGAVVLAYAFSPIDLIPDFIPVLGLLDDAVLLPAGVWLTLRLIPPEALTDARARAEAQLRKPRPVSLVGAAVVVAAWLGVAALAVAWIARRCGPP